MSVLIIPRRPPDPERHELILAPYAGGWQVWDRETYVGWVVERAPGLWKRRRTLRGNAGGRYPTRAAAVRALGEVGR